MLSKTFSTMAASSVMSLAMLTSPSTLAQQSADNVPQGTHQASDMGRVAPSQELNISVQLQMQNKAAFDQAVAALYDPTSPTYHKWMTEEDLKKYSPTKEQSDAVRNELAAHGLEILSADENDLSDRKSTRLNSSH